ncbi:hypothetical protein Tco_0243873, partial [Tanacetum coccineum]
LDDDVVLVKRCGYLVFHQTLTNGIRLCFNRLTLRLYDFYRFLDKMNLTEWLTVRWHSTSSRWIRETYYEPCSALEETQAL